MQVQTYDRNYINGQLLKYRSTLQAITAVNCLWRIASHADIFPFDELDCTGHLSDEQKTAVLDWLKEQMFSV